MAILALANTRILMHGANSRLGKFQALEMLRYGTRLVGFVASDVDNIDPAILHDAPLFPSIKGAATVTQTDLILIFDAGLSARKAVEEAIDAGIRTIVCLSEHVPVHDTIVMRHRARQAGATIVGPNSTGVLSPGLAKAGYFCEAICMPGNVGVIAKSGSLAYAVLAEMKSVGIGASTIVGIGGDIVKGSDYREHLALFQLDPDTSAIVMLGEIGGKDEENAASFIKGSITKPVVAFIAGRSAPIGVSMGHAGAIVERGRGSYAAKVEALIESGVKIADNIAAIVDVLTSWRVKANSH